MSTTDPLRVLDFKVEPAASRRPNPFRLYRGTHLRTPHMILYLGRWHRVLVRAADDLDTAYITVGDSQLDVDPVTVTRLREKSS